MPCANSLLLFALVAFLGAGEPPTRVDVVEIGDQFQLVGKLHVPLHQSVMVDGVVVEGPLKGYEGGPCLRVQRIDGLATQEDIQIVIRPGFGKAWNDQATPKSLPKLEIGATYRLKGYETGGFVGMPAEAFEPGEVVPQTCAPYFRVEFIVTHASKIDAISFSPREFTGQRALLSGRAVTRDGSSYMDGDGWFVLVTKDRPWPVDVEKKRIETDGKYDPTSAPNECRLIDGEWRLVDIEDQLGRDVALRGCAWSLNNHWWFRYRGVNLYVDGMEHLPGWSGSNHGAPILVHGRLEKAMLPRIDQISLKQDRDPAEYFIIRNATWAPLPQLLSPERPFPKIGQNDHVTIDRAPARSRRH